MQPDRVTHAVFATYAENMEAAADFWRALGVEFEEFVREDYGLRILFSWTHGVEIIACVDPEGGFGQDLLAFLHRRGEGFYKLNYGVADLDETVRRVNAYGVPCVCLPRTTTGREPWTARFTRCDEAMPDRVADMEIMFIEEESVDPVPTDGRICEASFALSPAQMGEAARFWRGALDVDIPPVGSPRAGVLTRFSADNGVWLMTPDPADPEPELAAFLDRCGGGAYGVTFRVRDLDRIVADAQARGLAVIERGGAISIGDQKRREAVLAPRFGMRVVLAEFEAPGQAAAGGGMNQSGMASV